MGARALFGVTEAVTDGAIGAGIGALITGRTTVYTQQPIQLTPLISRRGGGRFVSVTF